LASLERPFFRNSQFAISNYQLSILPSTHRILNDSSLLEARDRHIDRLIRLFAGEELDRPFVLCGVTGQATVSPYEEPEQWVSEALDDLAGKTDKLKDPAVFRPLVVECNLFGVHFIDRMFGAEVYEPESGKWDGWKSRFLTTPVGELQPPDLERDETWSLARRVAEAFLAADVRVPFFGLPTIASALNIALNLYGQRLLLAFHDAPDAAKRDLQVVNDTLCDLHRWYLERVPLSQLQPVVAAGRAQPPGFGQLCGCSTHLFSAEMYGEIVAPLDRELLSVYPRGGMIHLCGVHTQHLPVWREMKSLRSVQVNDRASEDLETYFQELRADQILYANPSATMPVDRILSITNARRPQVFPAPVVVVAKP